MSDEPTPRSFRQERDRVPFKRLAMIAVALNVVGVTLVTWSWLTLRARESALRPSGEFPERSLGPRREISGVEEQLFGERGEGQELTARKRASLEGYAWIDRKAKTVRVPIDVAMDLVVRDAAAKASPTAAPPKGEP